MDQPEFVYTSVNNIPFKVQADSGSDINLWPKNHFLRYCEEKGTVPKLYPSSKPIKAANKTIIKNLGWFPATLTSKYASVVSKIYVQDQEMEDLPLLSRFDLSSLGYMRIDPSGGFAAKRIKNERDLTDEEFKLAVDKIHGKFKKVFTGVGTYPHYTVDLHVKEDSEPFILRAIPCPIHLRKKALERLEYFEKLGILAKVPNGYPIKYCSPLLILKKPNKDEVRLVVNYKRLNLQLTRTRHVPATGLQDFCRVTRGFKYWFRLDLRHAFHQLKLSKKSQDLTIISTFNGCYKWLKMPQGLVNAGDFFDQIMENVMAGNTKSISVRDDVIGGGTTRREMLNEYEKVLASFEANNLTCDPSKTEVGLRSITFYGMEFCEEGMKPDRRKVELIKNSTPPTSHDALNSFVCMLAWNDIFIKKFAQIVRPLRDLANSKEKYEWKQIHQDAFDTVKKELSEHCLNNYFREDRETYLFTDAGKNAYDKENQNGGFSAILAQKDENGDFLAIHYSSRSISPTERKWGQVELEARALRYGIDKFRFYLEGIDIVYCMVDCKALLPLWNNNNRECPPRIDRQRLATQDIRMQLIHLPGAKNPADHFSRARNRVNDETAEDISDMDVSDALDSYLVKQINEWENREPDKPIPIDTIRDLTNKDPILKLVKERIQRNDWHKFRNDKRLKPYFGVRDELSIIDDIILRGSHRIVLPEELHNTAVALVHSLAHQGMTSTEHLLTNRLWFPGYSTAVRAEVDLCQVCKHTVISNRQEPSGMTTTPSRPFQEISVDFKGAFHDGYYALAFIDIYSKWPEIYFPTSTSFDAVKKYFDNFFSNYGFPRIIKSDSGPPFNGAPFKNYLAKLGIKHLPVIPETPWANEVENFNRSIRKAYDIARLKGWNYKDFMRRMLMVKRATPAPATKVSPHFAVTGRILDPGILSGNFPINPKSGLSYEQQRKIQQNLIESKLKTAERHNAKRNTVHLDLRPNDMVLVRLGKNKTPEKDHYKVIKVNGNEITAVNLRTGRVLRRHLSKFTRILERPNNPQPLQHRDDDEGDENHDHDQQIIMQLPNGDQPPQPPEPQRPQLRNNAGNRNLPPALNNGNRIPNELPGERRHPQPPQQPQPQQPRPQPRPPRQQQVRFNPEAQTVEYDTNSAIAPLRITRQLTRQTGVPVPNFPTNRSALEHSVRDQNTAQQMLNQFRSDTQQSIRLDRPPQNGQNQ